MLATLVSFIGLVFMFAGPYCLAGKILSRNSEGYNRAVLLVGTFVLGTVAQLIIFWLTILSGSFNFNVVAGISLMLFLYGNWLLPKSNWVPSFFHDFFVFLNANRIRVVVFYCLCAVLIFSLTRAILMPPMAWDGLTYHLYFPALWVQTGGFPEISMPAPTESYSFFPFNAEAIYSLWLLAFHGDLLVNVANFVNWLWLLLAVYALAREFKFDRDLSALFAAAISFAPMIYFQITISYVEIFCVASLCSALLFLIRFYRAPSHLSTLLFVLAVSIASGAKLSVLAHVIILLALFILAAFKNKYLFKVITPKNIYFLVPIFLVIIMISSGWYIRNFIERGNPFYPFGVSIFGQKILETSAYKLKVIQEILTTVSANTVNEWQALLNLFMYIPEQATTSAGPKFLILCLAAILLAGKRSVQAKNWETGLLILLALPSMVLIFISSDPEIVSTRQLWSDLIARIIAFPLCILALVGLIKLATVLRAKWLKLFLLLAVALDLAHLKFAYLDLNVNLILFVLIVALLVILIIKRQYFFVYAFPKLFVLLSLCGLSLGYIKEYRYDRKDYYYDHIQELQGDLKSYASCWHLIDRLPPSNINYLTSWYLYGHNWFNYSLLGSNFKHKVFYRPFAEVQKLDGNIRLDVQAWHSKLREDSIDYLFLQSPWPPEVVVASENPDLFKRIYADEIGMIIKILY